MNNDKQRAYAAKYRRENRAAVRLSHRRRNQLLKEKVVAALGGKCSCGEERLEALTVDHVNGDGHEHREGKTGYAVLRGILKESPLNADRYQVMCWNCHLKKTVASLRKEEVGKAAKSIRKLKDEVVSGYGGKCSSCGFQDRDCLTLDHVAGGGREERESRSGRLAAWYAARDGGFPPAYQVLCATCNAIKSLKEAGNPVLPFVSSGRIMIPPTDWKALKEKLSWEELRGFLVEATRSVELANPVTEQDAVRDFLMLRGSKNGTDLVGLKASGFFSFDSRMDAPTPAGPTCREWWSRDDLREKLVDMLMVWGAEEGVTEKNFLRYLKLKARMPQQLRPAFAKWVYDKFGAERVLDCCAGWGDRLAGFYASASARSYVGIDPNTRNQDVYARQAGCYSQFVAKSYRTICKPVEDVSPDDVGEFDLSFTSPPYFTAERYADEPTQSSSRYQDLGSWVTGFLRPFLELQREVVAGPVLVNIADHGKIPLERITVDLAETIGLRLVETLDYQISDRRGGRKTEPVFVFRR